MPAPFSACNQTLEPYLVEMRESAGGLEPVRFRERVRLAGPRIIDRVPGFDDGLVEAGAVTAHPIAADAA